MRYKRINPAAMRIYTDDFFAYAAHMSNALVRLIVSLFLLLLYYYLYKVVKTYI